MHRIPSMSRSLRRGIYRASPVILGVCVAAGTLVAAQHAVNQRAKSDLNDYTMSLLEHAESVAVASVDGLNKALSLPVPPCSEEDLTELRYIAFHSRYIKDVGRMEGGRVICTAIWGHLPGSVLLTVPSRMARGYSLWTNVPAPGDPRIRVDLASYGNAIVTTAPTAFDRVLLPLDDIGALIVTRDGRHRFQSFGSINHIHMAGDGSIGAVAGYMSSRVCSEKFDICAIGQASSGGIWGQPGLTLASILFLAMTGGCGAGSLLKVSQSRKRALSRMLAHAIKHGDIDLVYQPLRRLSDRQLVGVEALARWRTHAGKSIPPDVFVPMAEQQGLGSELAKLVIVRCLREVGSQLKPQGVYVSINLSAQDILDKGLRQFLSSQVEKNGVSSEDVVLELTERTSASQQELVAALSDLKVRGFRVYLDDFGTGYSNFAYLADLPLSGLKMDRRFTMAVGTNSPASHAVEAICVMAVALGLPLVAEGVEGEQQAAAVGKLVPSAVGQGWHLGRPSEAADIPWNSPEVKKASMDEGRGSCSMRERGCNV